MRAGASAVRLALVDGVTGRAWTPGVRIIGAVGSSLAGDRIVPLDLIRDPEHLHQIAVVLLEH